jgi:hypothetical protein
MDRLGLVRGQWLTEWQKRRVPHMHGVLFFPEGSVGLQEAVRGHWLDVAAPWGAEARGQVITPLWGLSGWLRYQAKHSGRSIRHAQRQGMPPGWTVSGRLWGVVGEWPTREEVHDVPMDEFHRFRRLMRSWLVSEARRSGDPRQVARVRGLLRDPERARSTVRAVGSFVPESVSRELLLAGHLGRVGGAGPRLQRQHVERRGSLLSPAAIPESVRCWQVSSRRRSVLAGPSRSSGAGRTGTRAGCPSTHARTIRPAVLVRV